MKVKIRLPKWWTERSERKRKEIVGKVKGNWFENVPTIDGSFIVPTLIGILNAVIFYLGTRTMFSDSTISILNTSSTLYDSTTQASLVAAAGIIDVMHLLVPIFAFLIGYITFKMIRTWNRGLGGL